MLILAVCGLPASGKGEFAEVARRMGLPVRSMGDMIRAEVEARGLEGGPEVFGQVAVDLRAEHGDEVLAVRLADAIDSDVPVPVLVIDGMRGTAERRVFQQRWGDAFQVVAIHADPDVRFARTQARGRAEDGSHAQFEQRDARELGWGVETLMTEAEHALVNRNPLSAFHADAERLLKSVLPDA